MGFLDAFLDPTKNTTKGYKKAAKQFGADTAGANSFYGQQLGNSGQAANQYADALGLNGVGSQQNFQDAFMTGPAYQANFDAGTAAIDQSAIFGGAGQSGNTLKALAQFGQNQYADEYNTYLDRLMGQTSMGYAAGAGQAGLSSQQQNYRLGAAQSKDQGNAAVGQNFSDLLGFGAGLFL